MLLAWPHQQGDWKKLLPEIEHDFLCLADAILQYELLIVICLNQEHRQHIRSQLAELDNAHNAILVEAPYHDTWCRDIGPIGVLENDRPLLLDFQFNGWGNRYSATLDNRVTGVLRDRQLFSTAVETVRLILEGGSIESNGDGTLLTTESCLLNRNRNAIGRQEIEMALTRSLALRQIHWLKQGFLEGDDTDGHIDNLARFVGPNTIACLDCEDPNDNHYSALRQMQNELCAFRQENGEPYTLVRLPLPDPCYSKVDDRRLPASYLNFLVINGAVLVPAFNCTNDVIACQALQQCFPDRKIIPVNSNGFIEQNGGIHCLTMQLIKGTLNREYLSQYEQKH